jgi:hypothetical protein
MERLFTAHGQWDGGYYELEIELGSRSAERLLAALEALWGHPALDGPYADQEREPDEQARVAASTGASASLFGVATLPGGARVPCRSGAVGPPIEDLEPWRNDSLDFSVPAGGLGAAWPETAGLPFGDGVDDRAWQEPLEEWFADIGRAVFERVEFRVGWICFETGVVDEEEWGRWLSDGVPAERSVGILRPEQAGLAWYPTTRWGRVEVDWSDQLLQTRMWRWRSLVRHRLRRLFRPDEPEG